jgi:hypothetical protein
LIGDLIDDDEKVDWPIYKPSMYDDKKIEFNNLDLPNLNKLDVSYDSLFAEESFIKNIIQKGSQLEEIIIWNWHCTDKSLDAISDNCHSLICIGLHVDGIRMTLPALEKLIKKCEQLKHIALFYCIDHTFTWPNIEKQQYYPVKALCQNRNITVGMDSFENMNKYRLLENWNVRKSYLDSDRRYRDYA